MNVPKLAYLQCRMDRRENPPGTASTDSDEEIAPEGEGEGVRIRHPGSAVTYRVATERGVTIPRYESRGRLTGDQLVRNEIVVVHLAVDFYPPCTKPSSCWAYRAA
jgi:hypothetical protein